MTCIQAVNLGKNGERQKTETMTHKKVYIHVYVIII